MNNDYEEYYGQYFDWLCEQINLRPGMYDILIHELYVIEFDWIIELDSNRADDGIVLRGEFYGTDSSFGEVASKPCSVLEALIGLSRKMDYILDDDDRGDRTRIWFWELIGNLGLDKYTDDIFESNSLLEGGNFDKLGVVRKVCSRWLNREFSYSGNGSPFPLNKPHSDQRKLQMIDQLNCYILEKHMYEDELM